MISRAKESRPLARFGATVATASDCSAAIALEAHLWSAGLFHVQPDTLQVLVMGGIEGHIIGGTQLACWNVSGAWTLFVTFGAW